MPCRQRLSAAALLSLAFLNGCGTIIKGGRQEIEIRSPVPDAEVTVKSFKGRDVYQGPPGPVKLAREDSYTITVRAPGYRERKVTVTKSISGWMFGNLIFIIPILWGVGVAVDAASGGLWTLGDSEVDVPLLREPQQPAPPAPAPVATQAPEPVVAPVTIEADAGGEGL